MQPWVDVSDLIHKWDTEGATVDMPHVASVGVYTWRDTNIYVILDNETSEIIDIHEAK